MMFAYTLNTDGNASTHAALRDAVIELNAAHLPSGYGLQPLWGTIASVGPSKDAIRGYEPTCERGHMLGMLHALRQLSRRFPAITITLSGGHGLLPTTLQDGTFEIFTASYEQALAARTGWNTANERVLRIS